MTWIQDFEELMPDFQESPAAAGAASTVLGIQFCRLKRPFLSVGRLTVVCDLQDAYQYDCIGRPPYVSVVCDPTFLK